MLTKLQSAMKHWNNAREKYGIRQEERETPRKSLRRRFWLALAAIPLIGVALYAAWQVRFNKVAPPLALTPFDSREARQHQDAWAKHLGVPVEATNGIGMKLLLIPAGEFLMGSAANDLDAKDNERPRHLVRVEKPFYLCQTEVTRRQWAAVMETTPWKMRFVKNGVETAVLFDEGDDYPVGFVNYQNALEFCHKLSRKEGKTYRLPTEAEWEYACRAGTETRYFCGDDELRLGEFAWFNEGAKNGNAKHAYPVAQKRSNPWGLHDMHGNEFEWCLGYSQYVTFDNNPTPPNTGSVAVIRSGNYFVPASDCRSAARFPDAGNLVAGLRCVQDCHD